MRKYRLKILLITVNLLLGATFWWISRWVNAKTAFTTKFLDDTGTLAQILSSFSFTLMGFLATILTVLFTFQDSPFRRAYARHNYLSDLVFFCLLIIFTLLCTFSLSVLLSAFPGVICWLFSLVTLNIFQITVISAIAYNLINEPK